MSGGRRGRLQRLQRLRRIRRIRRRGGGDGDRPDAPGYVTELDATSALLQATARGVRGEEFRGLGFLPSSPRLAGVANLPPRRAVERIYRLGGRLDALPPKRLDEVQAEEMRGWAAGQYEPRRYPAVAIGSANGAGAHLWTALGVFRRISSDHPEALSAPVADLHRWWYERRGLPVRRLLAPRRTS